MHDRMCLCALLCLLCAVPNLLCLTPPEVIPNQLPDLAINKLATLTYSVADSRAPISQGLLTPQTASIHPIANNNWILNQTQPNQTKPNQTPYSTLRSTTSPWTSSKNSVAECSEGGGQGFGARQGSRSKARFLMPRLAPARFSHLSSWLLCSAMQQVAAVNHEAPNPEP